MYTRRNFLRNMALLSGGMIGLPQLSFSNSFIARQVKMNYSSFPNNEIIQKARKNIEKYRKRPVEIQVLDYTGNPRKNFKVEVVQKSHAFPFGDQNCTMDSIVRKGGEDLYRLKVYRKLYGNVFNSLNATCYWTERPYHDMNKTEEFQGEPQLDSFEESVNWGNSENMLVKGHPLFWGVDKAIPQWVKKYPYETQLKFIEVRVRNLVAKYRGKIKMWDAINEALWEPALKNLSKRHWPHIETMENIVENIALILQWARSENPDAQYLINDYGLANEINPDLKDKNGQVVNVQFQRKRYIELAQRLQENGTPVDALGLQSHSGGWIAPAQQFEFYDQMTEAGLPLHITEYWAHTDHLRSKGKKLVAEDGDFVETDVAKKEKTYTDQEIAQIQADYVENYLTCAFGHPAIEAFFFWGFMGMAVKWSENSPSYRLQPVYERVRKLICETWNTSEILTTNSDGKLKLNAFHGNYALRYNLENKIQKGVNFNIDKYSSMPLKIVI